MKKLQKLILFRPSLRMRTALGVCVGMSLMACTSLPLPKVKKFDFPDGKVFLTDLPKRPYEVLGTVKAKVVWNSLHPEMDQEELCSNFFNKGANDLLEHAQKAGGDAVVEMRSVVVLMNKKVEFYPRAECVDDGEEGELMAQGIAIKWKPPVAVKGANKVKN